MSVFTKVSHAELEAFLAHYDLGTLIGYTGIGEGIENTNYFVDTSRGRWVLTLFERLNYDDLPFFLGLMEHLARHGYASALPVADNGGATLSSLNGKPAALVARLTGQSVLFPSLAQCAAVGHALGELHKLTASYSGTCFNARGVEWRRATGETLLPKVSEDARSLIADELAAQAQLDLASPAAGRDPRRSVQGQRAVRRRAPDRRHRLLLRLQRRPALRPRRHPQRLVRAGRWQPEPGAFGSTLVRLSRLPAADRGRKSRLAAGAARRRVPLLPVTLYDWTFPREGDLVHIKDPEPYRRILVNHRTQAAPGL